MVVDKEHRLEGEEAVSMATQIAATPVVKGAEAVKILKEASRKPSKESEKGAKKLASIFDRMMK